MWEIVKSGGILMLPIIIASILSMAIIFERAKRLRTRNVVPADVTDKLISQIKANALTPNYLTTIQNESPLGSVLVSGVLNSRGGLEYMTHQMQATANVEINKLEKHLNLLGTIGNISPMLGLIGTVLGIIVAFMAVSAGSAADPSALAAGISQALVTTAGGMFVAVPALVALRYFQRKIVDFAVDMEAQASKLVQVYYGNGNARTDVRSDINTTSDQLTSVVLEKPLRATRP